MRVVWLQFGAAADAVLFGQYAAGKAAAKAAALND